MSLNNKYPGDVDLLIDTIGMQLSMDLVERCGGTWLRVPQKPGGHMGDLDVLLEVIGIEATKSLTARCGGNYLRIPRRSFIKHRDHEIRSKYNQGGVTISDLAREYKMTDRHITTILGSDDEDDDARQCTVKSRQLPLFPDYDLVSL